LKRESGCAPRVLFVQAFSPVHNNHYFNEA